MRFLLNLFVSQCADAILDELDFYFPDASLLDNFKVLDNKTMKQASRSQNFKLHSYGNKEIKILLTTLNNGFSHDNDDPDHESEEKKSEPCQFVNEEKIWSDWARYKIFLLKHKNMRFREFCELYWSDMGLKRVSHWNYSY